MEREAVVRPPLFFHIAEITEVYKNFECFTNVEIKSIGVDCREVAEGRVNCRPFVYRINYRRSYVRSENYINGCRISRDVGYGCPGCGSD